MLGNYQLLNEYKSINLPQEAQSAFTEVTSNLIGASYKPILYVGYQLAHGTNHMIICEQTLSTKGEDRHIVKMIINEGILEKKDSKILSIEQII